MIFHKITCYRLPNCKITVKRKLTSDHHKETAYAIQERLSSSGPDRQVQEILEQQTLPWGSNYESIIMRLFALQGVESVEIVDHEGNGGSVTQGFENV